MDVARCELRIIGRRSVVKFLCKITGVRFKTRHQSFVECKWWISDAWGLCRIWTRLAFHARNGRRFIDGGRGGSTGFAYKIFLTLHLISSVTSLCLQRFCNYRSRKDSSTLLPGFETVIVQAFVCNILLGVENHRANTITRQGEKYY